MKCVCKYEYERDIGNEHFDKGDRPFIFMGSVMGVVDNETYYYEQYACPHCGTIKIKIEH